jgi:hypothetical protein
MFLLKNLKKSAFFGDCLSFVEMYGHVYLYNLMYAYEIRHSDVSIYFPMLDKYSVYSAS